MKDLQIVFRRYRDGDEFSIVRLLSVIWPGVDKWRDIVSGVGATKKTPSGIPSYGLQNMKMNLWVIEGLFQLG